MRRFALCNRFPWLDTCLASGVVCWAGLAASALTCPVCQSPRKKLQYGERHDRHPRFSDPNNRDTEGEPGARVGQFAGAAADDVEPVRAVYFSSVDLTKDGQSLYLFSLRRLRPTGNSLLCP